MRYQHCVLLPISLFLIVAGVVSLILLGVGNLEPYAHTKDFRMATCTVVYTNVSGEVPCTRFGEDETLTVVHQSWYPCVVVLVNYTELATDVGVQTEAEYRGRSGDPDASVSPGEQQSDDLVSAVNVMLYDTYRSWSMRRTGEANSTCSIHICHKKLKDNEDDVNDFFDDYGTIGDNFRCYFNPKNTDEVFAYVVTGNNVMHAFVWPGLAMGFGVFLLVVVAFLSCEVWICRNPKRAQRRMQGQIYELASYKAAGDRSRRGWRDGDGDGQQGQRELRSKRRGGGGGGGGDGNNNSRLPNLSAAADIIRKWSYRGRSDRRSRATDTNRSSQSYAGNPSTRWSLERTEKSFSTT